jgi:hypothetical protein
VQVGDVMMRVGGDFFRLEEDLKKIMKNGLKIAYNKFIE